MPILLAGMVLLAFAMPQEDAVEIDEFDVHVEESYGGGRGNEEVIDEPKIVRRPAVIEVNFSE